MQSKSKLNTDVSKLRGKEPDEFMGTRIVPHDLDRYQKGTSSREALASLDDVSQYIYNS